MIHRAVGVHINISIFRQDTHFSFINRRFLPKPAQNVSVVKSLALGDLNVGLK